ncbi:hypothetical protein M527_06450 [Sphingobium indicum IP26]|uniref:Uncharacterized protein n=1 Tax=Sphingobium indicum F2 TaxID=1450518 RepID=A0A8E0WTU0_9SPHN|nr:packaged DNA stabilization gp4 family protein [Sphingobium indicum]EPR09764.1 hypothetical protein M527_06450 [Sphingobium indicum IP26]KER37286.1 hypothetical protein AL00_06345 [Sphingobium indicum F2]
MSVSWGSKDPNEVRNVAYSWLGRLNGAEIASATLTVQDGTVTLSNVANTTTGISATVSGGQDCETATIVSRIVTDESEPQTLEQAFTIEVRDNASALGPSTSTKRQIVEMAYEECSLSGYEFNVTPEELFSGLRSLDALMAEWAGSSKDLGYNFPATFGGGGLEDVSGIPDVAINGVAISLAMSLAPKMGKQMSAETRARLSRAMSVIGAVCARQASMGWARSTVAGAGNRRWGWGPSYGSPFMTTRRPCR